MKNIKIVSAAFIATFAGLLAIADVTQTSAAVDTLINDKDFKGEAIESINEAVVDIAAIVAVINAGDGSVSYQVDTNASVDVTTITPTAVGSVLLTPNATTTFTEVSVNGAITNSYTLRIAVNVDGTTNGWVKIATDK